ncbi:MAG: hypothetical protein JW976_12155 [Syntrophaceae bacterium]|nr:hypothetical protein [Syntrophaceae bacterium]
MFYHDLHRINFITCIEWCEREKLLKVGFPVAIRAHTRIHIHIFKSFIRSSSIYPVICC